MFPSALNPSYKSVKPDGYDTSYGESVMTTSGFLGILLGNKGSIFKFRLGKNGLNDFSSL